MTVKRMDNVLIVVDDLEAVKAFFIGLGPQPERFNRVYHALHRPSAPPIFPV